MGEEKPKMSVFTDSKSHMRKFDTQIAVVVIDVDLKLRAIMETLVCTDVTVQLYKLCESYAAGHLWLYSCWKEKHAMLVWKTPS